METKLPEKTALGVLTAISLAHCMTDTTQSLIIALYPLFKEEFSLSFTQIGLLSFAYQMCASVLQPLIGYYADKRPRPAALPMGMTVTLFGLLMMAFSPNYLWLLAASIFLGIGSAVFHPESSRVAHMASAGRYGLAQSLFQVGGNAGQAIGPLIAALFVMIHGQRSLAIFSVIPLLAIIALIFISRWAAAHNHSAGEARGQHRIRHPRAIIIRTLVILFILMLSKQVYTVCIANFFTFYLMQQFGVSTETSQIYLFIFLGAVALGTFLGGPIGDRIGRKQVIWGSILGAAPFTLALPYVGLHWTILLAAVAGFIMASSFSAILVFAQELVPGHVGAIAGLFFGLAFGLGGIGAAALGKIADSAGVVTVFIICSYLPLMGILTALLPAETRNRG
ncbi:MAG TPA: MFS transporter [Desulfobulbaceae bacterium]|nr:MFS transporter [Desulfobulbaceae bacterium]